MVIEYKAVNASFINGMSALVFYHTVNTILGGACSVIAGINLLIFLGSAKFRVIYKILTALALADFINTIAMMIMGINRVNLYSHVIDTLTIPVRTSWDCAIEPWLWLKGIGDLWPPVIQLCMGMERACSIMYPVFFRETVERKGRYVVFGTVFFVVCSLSVGFGMAFMSRHAGPVMYYCGRKAAFSKGYGSFIYCTNVCCYCFGFCFNMLAYGRAMKLKQSTNRSNHIRRIRYYLFISLFSTVLVSVPNLISLCSSWLGEINDAISKPSVWMACINSALSPFLYFVFNREYRERCKMLLECHGPHKNGIITTQHTARVHRASYPSRSVIVSQYNG